MCYFQRIASLQIAVADPNPWIAVADLNPLFAVAFLNLLHAKQKSS